MICHFSASKLANSGGRGYPALWLEMRCWEDDSQPSETRKSFAGRSSKNRDLKQANHHHIKRTDLTDGEKKVILNREIKTVRLP